MIICCPESLDKRYLKLQSRLTLVAAFYRIDLAVAFVRRFSWARHVRTPRKARSICPESAGQLTCSKYRRLAVLRRSRTFSEGLKCATAGRKSRTIRRLFGTGLTPVPLSSELWPSRKTRGWPLPHRPRQIRAKLSHSFSTPLNPNSQHNRYKPDTNQNYHNQPARWGVGLEQHIQGHKHHD